MEKTFDEKHYLETWWDVAQAVRSGQFISGRAHWLQHGRAENRVFRFEGDKKDRGVLVPTAQRYLDDISLILRTDYKDYRHRGFRVPCCMEQKTRDRIREAVQPIRGGRIAEVGVFGGATLLDLAADASAGGNRLIGIDPWETSEMVASVADAVARAELSNFFKQMRRNLEAICLDLDYHHVELMQAEASEAALQVEDESLDFLLVDGDHQEVAVRKDLEMFWPKMRPGAALWGDDYDWASVRRAVDKFAGECGVEVERWNVQFILKKPQRRER